MIHLVKENIRLANILIFQQVMLHKKVNSNIIFLSKKKKILSFLFHIVLTILYSFEVL